MMFSRLTLAICTGMDRLLGGSCEARIYEMSVQLAVMCLHDWYWNWSRYFAMVLTEEPRNSVQD